jgi:outer membrane lipoprotein carrier protein
LASRFVVPKDRCCGLSDTLASHPCTKRKDGAPSWLALFSWRGGELGRPGAGNLPILNIVKLTSILLKFVGPLLATALAAAAPAPDVHAIAQAVDERYNHLHTLQAEFTEIYRGAGTERTESGTLWLKKPGKMRWEYRSPREKLFLSDGKDAWFYVPGERQVRRTAVKKLDDLRSPLAFLLGKTKLEKELQGLSLAPDVSPLATGDVVLRGVPKSLGDRVSQVLLEITPERWIGRILIEEVDGSVTEYRFSGQKEDIAVADQRFQFTAPDGVEVIDGDWGQ